MVDLKQMVLWIFLIGTALASQKEEEDMCPICFDEFSKCETQMKTSCGHKFCGNCFLENFCKQSKNKCSICRQIIDAYRTIVDNNNLVFMKKFILNYPEILTDPEYCDGDHFIDIVEEKNKQDILDFMTLYIEKAPMLYGAVESGDYETIKSLLQEIYVNPNAIPRGKNKNLPLIIALQNNRQDIAKLLIENGAYVNQENNENHTSLFEAVEEFNIENVKFLLDNGADPNIPEYQDEIQNATFLPIWKAETVEIAQLLIDYGAKFLERFDDEDESILTHVSDIGNADLVKFYINQGLDVNHVDENGTPLTHAIDGKNIEVAEILLNNGADPNIEHQDHTLLQLSITKKKKRLMKALLLHGANPFMKDNTDHNALDSARTINTDNVLATKILKEYAKHLKEYAKNLKRKREENE